MFIRMSPFFNLEVIDWLRFNVLMFLVFHQYFTNVSPMFRQCFTSFSPVFHQCFISVLPLFHQFFTSLTSVSKVFQKCFKSVSKVLWECFQSVCQSQCFKVICSHWSHRSCPSIRRVCFNFKNIFGKKNWNKILWIKNFVTF